MSNSEAVKYTTEWVRHDGREFYTITCEPEKQPVKATLTLVHGIGEHVDRYEHMIRRFAQAGIKVHAYDQRGFGKTGRRGGTLGDNEGFKKVLDDVTAACRRTRIEGVPHFLFGHSMGGMIVLHYAIHRKNDVSLTGVLSSAPAVEVAEKSQPNCLVLNAAKIAARILPTFPKKTGLDVNLLSHDQQVVRDYVADEYNIDFASLRTLVDVLTRGPELKYYVKDFNIPVAIAHGGSDGITDHNASKDFFEKLPDSLDKTYFLYEGLYHELHFEPEKETIIQDYINWILERAASENNTA